MGTRRFHRGKGNQHRPPGKRISRHPASGRTGGNAAGSVIGPPGRPARGDNASTISTKLRHSATPDSAGRRMITTRQFSSKAASIFSLKPPATPLSLVTSTSISKLVQQVQIVFPGKGPPDADHLRRRQSGLAAGLKRIDVRAAPGRTRPPGSL